MVVVVGGVVGLSALAFLAFFFLNRRRVGNSSNILGPWMRFNRVHDQQSWEPPKLYDPADPSTFPSPLPGGNSLNPGKYKTNTYERKMGTYQDGRYSGAAEL